MSSFTGAMKWSSAFAFVVIACFGCQPSPDQPSPPAPIADPTPPASASASAAPTSATQLCTVGQDQTCNENPAMSSIHGKCTAAGKCECIAPFTTGESGRCN